MLKTELINSQSKDLLKIENLYIKSFPENERSPLNLLLNDESKCSEIFALYDNTTFCGFISLLNHNNICHILYLAVEETLRNKKYGSKMLKLIRQMKKNYRIIADIESAKFNSPNYIQRKKRKQFYLNNNFIHSNISYTWRNDFYEILVTNGSISKKEFWNFWNDVVKINPNFDKF